MVLIENSQFVREKHYPKPINQLPNECEVIAQPDDSPLVSLVVPAYNEAGVIETNLELLCHYMKQLEDEYRWEIIVVNDGSIDRTGELAEALATSTNNIRVVHHLVNFGLGQALKSGFSSCKGDYVVVVDLDLSYAPYHIGRLLTKIRETKAMIVVASPYMKGGKISNVPWFRRSLSIWANRFLSFAAKRSLATLTGMVRVYDARFLKAINLKSMSMEINPEILHKAKLLGVRVAEIPAHLHWQPQKAKKTKRRSSMRILAHSWAIFFYGFLFRPVMFFIIPSLVLFLVSVYANLWVLIHCLTSYQQLAESTRFPDPTEAVAIAFQHAPHTFMIGGMTLMLAIQLFSLGILAVQSKSYFEEIFYLGSSIYASRQGCRRDKTDD
ncbi:MAG: glycosyltransferase family 2 protein [Coleofasciculus sp. S288]|nr:glycosyltransferase family 2 protein [Coleofasciculus sp. S288]